MRSDSWAGLPVQERLRIVHNALKSRANSTVKKYLAEYRKYRTFLAAKGYSTVLPSMPLHVTSYLSHLYETNPSYSAILHAHCAIKWIHGLLPIHTHDNPANTLLATSIVEASKRSFSKPPQKKEPLTIDIVRRVCEKFAGPSCTLNNLRAALIFSLGFSGLFRVGELLQLTAANIDIASSHLEITVKRSKTDHCCMSSSIMLSFNLCFGFLFVDLNKMNFVFLIFKDNLLTFSHSVTL